MAIAFPFPGYGAPQIQIFFRSQEDPPLEVFLRRFSLDHCELPGAKPALGITSAGK